MGESNPGHKEAALVAAFLIWRGFQVYQGVAKCQKVVYSLYPELYQLLYQCKNTLFAQSFGLIRLIVKGLAR